MIKGKLLDIKESSKEKIKNYSKETLECKYGKKLANKGYPGSCGFVDSYKSIGHTETTVEHSGQSLPYPNSNHQIGLNSYHNMSRVKAHSSINSFLDLDDLV